MAFYTFLPKILNMSLTASVAIVFVLLLRLLLKKAPKVISYALWAVVLIRLLCPVSIESGLSLFGLFDTPTVDMTEHSSAVEYIPSNIVHTEFPEVVLPVPGVGEAITEVLPQGEEQLRADPLEGPMFIATYIWWGGILVMAIYGIVTYLRLRRKLITASPLRDNIYLADDIDSPFVMGLFRPKIYLPSAMEEREQSYILLHEQHHIRRLDHVVKALAFVALCIHWFNPLVWVAFILSGKDMEMSCDEAVVRKLGTQIRADYTASLLSLATGKRIIAGMPLAFGEGNTKGRIRNLANWKKPAFWVVLVAVIACIVLAVCLLTNPETKQDLSFLNYENLVSVAAQSDTHPASKSDDQSRYIIDGPQLAKLLDTSKWIAQTGITRRIQRDTDQNSKSSIQITLDGTYLKVFDTDTANIYDPTTGKDRYYRMAIGDYEKLLAMLSLDNEHATNVTKWFDYHETPDEMKWDGSIDISLPEFPDVTFRWSYVEIVAVKGNEITSLYTGMPIWNTYFCDLSGDGLPELCSTLSWGSGMIDNRVMIYDYANGVSYSLEDRGVSDYTLRQDESDGYLYVDKKAHLGGALLSTGRLVFEDNCLQVLWPEKPNDNIREITDPTDDPNFAYDTAVEKIYEDERNDYFISGLYSQHIIVHYTDGTQEDIVTALNAGKATFADLDKFGIRYWAEPKADPLEAAISAEILEHYHSNTPDGLIHVESHVMLANETMSGTPLFGADNHIEKVTAYLLVHHVKYSTYGGTLEAVGGSYVPTAITFRIGDSGEHILEEYWEPRDGSYYVKDVRDKFPGASADDALNDQAYIEELKAQTHNKALAYLNNNISLDVRIAELLDEIQVSPAQSSNPGAYIREHQTAYEELLSYGEYTLRYCFAEFLHGGQIDLRGHIMALACQDIADALGEKEEPLENVVMTGQDWFDGFSSYAQVLAKNNSAEELEKHYPATFLLLQMSDSEYLTKGAPN